MKDGWGAEKEKASGGPGTKRHICELKALKGELPAPIRSWEDSLGPFRERHAAWWGRHGDRGPAYCLPAEVVAALQSYAPGEARRRRAVHTLIGPEDAEAERHFAHACLAYAPTIVGAWDGRPIDFPLLARPQSFLAQAEREWDTLGWGAWTPARIRGMLAEIEGLADADRHQRLGYAGRLTFDNQFRREKAALEARWAEMDDRPPFPLIASTADRPPSPVSSILPYLADVVPEDAAAFLQDVGRFLRKWQLARLVTWDLPEPQGPLGPIPLILASAMLGPEVPVRTFPSYYDISSGQDMRGLIRDDQEWQARGAGIAGMQHPVTDTSARGRSPSTYENAFRLWLIERSVRDRYGAIRGLVARLVPAFAQTLGCSEDRVRQLRRSYPGHLGG